jgi:hypothetical protein
MNLISGRRQRSEQRCSSRTPENDESLHSGRGPQGRGRLCLPAFQEAMVDADEVRLSNFSQTIRVLLDCPIWIAIQFVNPVFLFQSKSK